MSRKDMYYNPEADKWYTLDEVIESIKEIANCTDAEATLYLNDSIGDGILYDYNGYIEHFAPYENN